MLYRGIYTYESTIIWLWCNASLTCPSICIIIRINKRLYINISSAPLHNITLKVPHNCGLQAFVAFWLCPSAATAILIAQKWNELIVYDKHDIARCGSMRKLVLYLIARMKFKMTPFQCILCAIALFVMYKWQVINHFILYFSYSTIRSFSYSRTLHTRRINYQECSRTSLEKIIKNKKKCFTCCERIWKKNYFRK